MKKLLLTALAGSMIAAPVFAGGSHGAGHDHEQRQAGHAMAGHDHGHGEMGHSSQVGQPADPASATKTIKVEMLDSMEYVFQDSLDIAPGDVVRFVVTNKGNLQHEFSIGSEEEQQAHAEMMRRMPDMIHTDGNTLSLAGGESGELTWRFDGAPEVIFACNVPGHTEAGMSMAYRMVIEKHSHGDHSSH